MCTSTKIHQPVVSETQGLMHLQGKPVCSFDPEGLIFAAGINSEMVKLYDLRSFDKVRSMFQGVILTQADELIG